MSDINQVSLPENYYTVTSPMLLAQPEPQFLYAQMFLSAMGLAASLDSGEFPEEGAGAPYSDADRDRLKLSREMLGGLHAAKVDFKGLPGHSVRINRPAFTDTTYSLASREVGVNTSISTQTINAGSEQVSLQLSRYAGPYDSANSRVAPYGIDKFAAQSGIHNLRSLTKTHLVRDFHKFLDKVHCDLADTASTVVRPASMSTDDSATSVGHSPMDYDTLCRAELAADNANLPMMADGYRVIVLTPTQIAQLRLDGDFVELSKDHPQFNGLFPQYVTSVNRLHVFKSTTLNTPTNSSTVAIHRGHLLCPGTFLGGMGEAPRIAPSNDTNFGEVAKVIWVAYLAMGLADNRFAISVRTSA